MFGRRICTLFLVIGLAACGGRKPGDPIRPGFNVFSMEQDVELGRQAAAQIRQQVDIVDNPELQNYVQSIGQRLAAQPEAGKFPYTFSVINDKSINAFALPGGPIFINSGTVAQAENEAQLAGVMAHEIAHVALRHSTNQVSKANILQLPAAIAGAVIGQGSAAAQLGQIGLGVGANLLMLKYSRSAESQADALGARILAQTGYNPIEMARFFEKLDAEGGSRAPQFLSDHPNPGNRVQAVQAEIQTFPRREYTAGTGQFQRQQQLAARLPAPRTAQRARYAEPQPGGVTGGFRQVQGRDFAIAYPDAWQAFSDNQSGIVAIGPREGFVQNQIGGVSVGYGAILGYYPVRGDLQQATQDLLVQMQQNNPSMQLAARARRVRVDNSQGLITTLRSASPYGGPERDILLTVNRPEGLFYMVFIAPEQNFAAIQPAFEQMLNSIRFR